jgi:hypothetical protein
MKEFKKADGKEQRSKKKFNDYDFTPLNAGISDVIMEIKRDPNFRQPQKIPSNHPYKNEGKYCDFHKQAGHYTEGCIALTFLIDELIKNGKLVRFLGEQKNQPVNNRPRIVETISPGTRSLGIIIHETVLNEMRGIERIIPERI